MTVSLSVFLFISALIVLVSIIWAKSVNVNGKYLSAAFALYFLFHGVAVAFYLKFFESGSAFGVNIESSISSDFLSFILFILMLTSMFLPVVLVTRIRKEKKNDDGLV